MRPSDAYLARFEALHPKKIDLTLGRIERLLAKLGHPERVLPKVIHVAGTNGKGSTVAFCRAMLEAAGKAVHVYTSPHLIRFHERIRIGRPGGGKLVEEMALVDAFERMEQANAGEPITFWEITTAAAIHLFATNPADAVLMEVGLGGRCDGTNVFDHPAAAVVTPVSIDHREHLGETAEIIAIEKAGIFKRGAPAIIAPQEAGPSAVLEREARRVGAMPFIGGQDFSVHEENGRLVYQDERGLLDLPLPRLTGRHQLVNAGTAIAALRSVFGEAISADAVSRGLLGAEWPARLQRLTGKLAQIAPQDAEIWVDGGHNADGARVLSEAMVAFEERAPRPLIVLTGMMQRKPVPDLLLPFVGLAREVYALPVRSNVARTPEEIAAEARSLGFKAAVAGSITETLHFLAGRNWPAPPRILIMGSLYLAGEVLELDGVTIS